MFLKRTITLVWRLLHPVLNTYGRYLKTPYKVARNRQRSNRQLEIGPGPERIDGFETVNIVWAPNVDYVSDASKELPFRDSTFSLIYASHILEHVPWYKTQSTLAEWARILKPGGVLEIWVPNGLLIAKTWIDAEEGGENRIEQDGWYKFNHNKDPAVWANGRVFSYGDGTGRKSHPNWHLAMFSPRLLKQLFLACGFVGVEEMERADVRAYDHGWINLGIRGRKP